MCKIQGNTRRDSVKKKSLAGLLVILALGVVTVGGYYWSTDFASDKIADKVTDDLAKSGKLEELKETIGSDPEVKKFLEQQEQEPAEEPVAGNSVAAAEPEPEATEEPAPQETPR